MSLTHSQVFTQTPSTPLRLTGYPRSCTSCYNRNEAQFTVHSLRSWAYLGWPENHEPLGEVMRTASKGMAPQTRGRTAPHVVVPAVRARLRRQAPRRAARVQGGAHWHGPRRARHAGGKGKGGVVPDGARRVHLPPRPGARAVALGRGGAHVAAAPPHPLRPNARHPLPLPVVPLPHWHTHKS